MLNTSLRAVLALSFCVCIMVPACSRLLGPNIVGKWESTVTPSHKIEFFADGTLCETALLKTNNGKYTLHDGNRLMMEVDGLLWGTNTIDFRYSIDGDTLTLVSDAGLTMTMRKSE